MRSLGADHVIDYTAEDFTLGKMRYDVVLDNVINHPPTAVAKVLSASGVFIPNSIGNTGRIVAGLPRMARAAIMGIGSTQVETVRRCVINQENLNAIAALLTAGDIRVVIDTVYPLSEAASAVAHMLGHHAKGEVVIAVGAEDR